MQNQNFDVVQKKFLLAHKCFAGVEIGVERAMRRQPAKVVVAMPISDTYLVQFLVQETTAVKDELVWSEKDTDGYVAHNHGVQIELDHVMSRAGTRRQLTLAYEAERIYVLEPTNTGILTEQYANEEAWRLVQLLRELNLAVSRQCAARRNRSEEAMSQIRESMYRRVIGVGDPDLEQLVSR